MEHLFSLIQLKQQRKDILPRFLWSNIHQYLSHLDFAKLYEMYLLDEKLLTAINKYSAANYPVFCELLPGTTPDTLAILMMQMNKILLNDAKTIINPLTKHLPENNLRVFVNSNCSYNLNSKQKRLEVIGINANANANANHVLSVNGHILIDELSLTNLTVELDPIECDKLVMKNCTLLNMPNNRIEINHGVFDNCKLNGYKFTSSCALSHITINNLNLDKQVVIMSHDYMIVVSDYDDRYEIGWDIETGYLVDICIDQNGVKSFHKINRLNKWLIVKIPRIQPTSVDITINKTTINESYIMNH